MNMRPALTLDEKKLSYSKYYDLPMTPIPKEKLEILENGPIDPALALPIEQRNDLFIPGYLPCEVGYCVMDNGTGYVSNLTKMPGVTAEMFEWWFAWHSLHDLRYRIWDPEDHFGIKQHKREKALDHSIPMRERTWGTTHTVLEDAGSGVSDLILNFRYPKELGYEEEKVGTDVCATMMCADGINPNAMAIMTHFVREVEDGIELRSRFWMGYGFVDGKIIKLIPDGVRLPIEPVQGLFAHNIKEFSHLASILPRLYKDEKNNF